MAKKSFYVVVASKANKKVPLDEVVYANTVNGSVARYASYDEANQIALDHANHDHETSFVVMKAMAAYEPITKISRVSLT